MEAQYLSPGSTVEVHAAFGERLTRRVVAVRAGRVYVCTDGEYRAAKRAGRDPVAVGFRSEAIIRGS